MRSYEYPAKNLHQPGREDAAKQAEAWTAHQAQRLGVTSEAILATVLRGWTSERIEAAGNAAELIGAPR